MSNTIEVYCDFDGTVTMGDTTDVLLAGLADPSWREIEKLWEAGKIGSRECMKAQVSLMRGGWTAMRAVLDTVSIDPTFASFAQWCRQSGVSLRIVSDGLDKVINYLLVREGIRVDFVWANRLQEAEDGSFSLLFPYSIQDKMCSSGVCKCKVLDSGTRKTTRVVIGDGRSDFCWAGEADILFAKSQLANYCLEKNLAFHQFDDFSAIRNVLQDYLEKLPEAVQVPIQVPILVRAS